MNWINNPEACYVFGLVYLMVVGGVVTLLADRIICAIRERRMEK